MANSRKRYRFAVCIADEGADDLQAWKLYRVLPDDAAAEENYLRVVDESGEDYLYPQSFFAPIELPQPIRRAVLAAV